MNECYLQEPRQTDPDVYRKSFFKPCIDADECEEIFLVHSAGLMRLT